MTLATIKISDEIRNQTNHLISNYTYETLRQYILRRQSLPPVNEAIDSILLKECNKDKQQVTDRLKNVANEQQITNDTEEAKRDAQEKKLDDQLRANLNKLLPELKKKSAEINEKFNNQLNKANLLFKEINDLEASLRGINRQISQVRSSRQLVVTQIPYTYYSIRGHHHHHHHHCQQFPEVMYNSYPFYQQSSWAYSLSEEENLKEQRDAISRSLAIQTPVYNSNRLILNELTETKNDINQKIQTISSQLEQELLSKANHRQFREQQRLNRALTRIANKNDPQQLSSSAAEELNKKISIETMRLNNIFKQLQNNSRSYGYSIFLDELNEMLNHSRNQIITLGERNALKSMLALINRYEERVTIHDKTILSLKSAKNHLNQLQTIESNITTQINDSKNKYENAIAQQNSLQSERNNLNQRLNSAKSIKTSMLFTSLFGVTSGGVSAGLVIVYATTPSRVGSASLFNLCTKTKMHEEMNARLAIIPVNSTLTNQ